MKVFLVGMVALALAGCGGDGGTAGSGENAQTYCEVSCGCSARLGAPSSIVEQCVNSCSQGGGTLFDSCPEEVAALRDCLYATSNCDSNQCLSELDALTDCTFP